MAKIFLNFKNETICFKDWHMNGAGFWFRIKENDTLFEIRVDNRYPDGLWRPTFRLFGVSRSIKKLYNRLYTPSNEVEVVKSNIDNILNKLPNLIAFM